MHFISLTKQNVLKVIEFVDHKTFRRAWLETKRTYVKQKGAYARNNLLTYRKLWIRRFCLQNLIAARRTKKKVLPESPQDPIIQEFEDSGETRLCFYKRKVEEFIPADYDIRQLEDLISLEMEMSSEVHESYIEEVEMII